MPASPDPDDSIPLSDNDRLIAAVQSGFSDLKEEMRRTVESFKPPAPATDAKTTFWNIYMKLADEHDKEFLQKYSTDLDTSLIFAGLFSAVSSAFIIQIQPQLTTSPTIIVVIQSLLYTSLFTTLLAALLAVLGKQWIMYYHAAGSRGTIEERGLERQRKLDGLRKWKFDAVLQMFPLLLQLALLLFASALSLYLWTINHAIAIVVLTITSFGFGSYLFLLISATIFSDSPFQSPIAAFIVQTLLPPKSLKREFRWKYIYFQRFVSKILNQCSKSGRDILPRFGLQPSLPKEDKTDSLDFDLGDYHFDPASREVPAVLWVLETSTDPVIIGAAAEIAVDLQWPLDLDAALPVNRLAETLRSCVNTRFVDGKLIGQVQDALTKRAINCVRASCSLRVIAAGVDLAHWWFYQTMDLIPAENVNDPTDFEQLLNAWRIAQGQPELPQTWEPLQASTWALHIIPGSLVGVKWGSIETRVEHFLGQIPPDKMPMLDQETFANYLCCISALLGHMSPRVIAQKNKRHLQGHLMAHFFRTLQRVKMDASLVGRIILTTAGLYRKMITKNTSYYGPQAMKAMLEFCSNFYHSSEMDADVLASAATLAKLTNPRDLAKAQSELDIPVHQATFREVEWIYRSLEHIQSACEERGTDFQDQDNWDNKTVLWLDSLLQALACSGELPTHIPLKALHIILLALSAPGDIAVTAFIVLERGYTWFQDPELWAILQQSDVWARIGKVSINLPQGGRYISLGNAIVNIPEWKQIIANDFPPWITALTETGYHREMFHLVMRKIWIPNFDEQRKFYDEGEKSWALAVTALTNVWDAQCNCSFDPHEFARLARCTVSASLLIRYMFQHSHNIRSSAEVLPESRATFSKTLGEVLIQAAESARTPAGAQTLPDYPDLHAPQDRENTLECVAQFLEALGTKISTEFTPGNAEVQIASSVQKYDDWESLERIFMTEIDRLEGLFDCAGATEA